MSTKLQTRAKATSIPKPSLTLVQTQLLQRKCACGGTPGVGGECGECRSKRLSVQRSATNQATSSNVPPTVHDVLRSPGQSLDAETRAFMEPRLGHDFSQVRVHTDARAAESARAVNALAYTVGRDMVFGTGQYAPETLIGKDLLAHELIHTIQQNASILQLPATLQREHPEDTAEKEALKAANSVMQGQLFPPITSTTTKIARQMPDAGVSTAPLDSGTPSPAAKCTLATPKACSRYEEWLNQFPSKPSSTGDLNITASMPKDLQNLITGKLSKGGGLPDCADVAMILRHYYLKAKELSTEFLVGPTRETAETFTLGKDVTDKEMHACLIGAGSESFQETRAGFGLVDFYRKSVRKKKENVTNLKDLVSAGLKPGDLFVWKRRIAATGFQGHVQTVQAITLPKFDPKDPSKLITPGTITIVQGTMVSGKGLGQIQQRQYTFKDLTGKDDGDDEIKDTDEESFFGAGPWKLTP